jgi:hypothetical protein
LPLSSEARADQGCRKRRNQVPDWSEIRCRFAPKSPAAFDRNQVPVCSDFCSQAPHLPAMTPDLSDEEAAALVRLLSDTINNDRYPL